MLKNGATERRSGSNDEYIFEIFMEYQKRQMTFCSVEGRVTCELSRWLPRMHTMKHDDPLSSESRASEDSGPE